MRRICVLWSAVILSALALATGYVAPDASAGPPETLKKLFSSPTRDYSTGPLWVWNDMLTEQQVVESLRDLAAQGIRQVWVHPRPGLMTPYLSDEWFRLWKASLREAERLDMNVWIYDENSYPSGFAGGFVPDAMPESRGRGLELKESKVAPQWTENTMFVYSIDGDSSRDISVMARAGSVLPEGNYVTASLLSARTSPWHGGKTYVDLMYPGVTRKFLSITMDKYLQEIGSEFGRRVPGVFTDEPEIRPAGGLPWTPDLPSIFEKQWGYSLNASLPSLVLQVGDWRKVRHNYYQTLLSLFVERWARPYYEYCEKNRLEFTGHYWEHEWPNAAGVPDNMAMSSWQQRPGIDTLMNQYSEDVHAQFGNVRAVKEVSSLANQLGRGRTLCEAYGAGGWDLRFEDMKRIGDWLYVLGINTLNQHLSYVTVRGARKRDHPQSFSYHEPWWQAYRLSADYFSRLTVAMTAGEQVNEILVLEPTTAAWMHNSGGKPSAELQAIGNQFQSLVTTLEKAQVEYDLGCEDVMARAGSVAGKALRVGRRSYRTVVIPPLTENLNLRTVELLADFARAGGRLISCGVPPARVNGAVSDRGKALASLPGWAAVAAADLPGVLVSESGPDFRLRQATGDRGLVYHHRRRLPEGELVFVTNTSIDSRAAATLESAAKSAEVWNLETGSTSPALFEGTATGIRVPVDLPPCGSVLLFLSKNPGAAAPAARRSRVAVEQLRPLEIRRAAPNLLVLDFVDITAGTESLRNAYFYQASQLAFRANGMPRNPWDSAVQFRDELIRTQFPPRSGFTATYRFRIREKVPAGLRLVVERPDLYTVKVNGTAVKAKPGEWWLDRAFGSIDIGDCVRTGENSVELAASPMTIFHELEPAYVLGDFALEPAEQGFEIAPPRPLTLGKWNEQGMPFLAEGVTYSSEFKVDAAGEPLVLSVPSWYGSVVRVAVNGKPAGFISHAPWELDVSAMMRGGTNRIDVTVIGTLKNSLGPHHGNPAPGTAWPAMFQKGPESGPPPGRSYSTFGYGLFAPFVLYRE